MLFNKLNSPSARTPNNDPVIDGGQNLGVAKNGTLTNKFKMAKVKSGNVTMQKSEKRGKTEGLIDQQ